MRAVPASDEVKIIEAHGSKRAAVRPTRMKAGSIACIQSSRRDEGDAAAASADRSRAGVGRLTTGYATAMAPRRVAIGIVGSCSCLKSRPRRVRHSWMAEVMLALFVFRAAHPQ